jgi:uncharacterized membrane protein
MSLMLESTTWQQRESGDETELAAPHRHLWARVLDRSLILSLLVYLAVISYIIFFTWLSILRHETFQSNAMDLGYTDQVVWNTLHGRFLQFSTLQEASIDLPLDQFRRTDVLLAFHVEPILLPISLLYLVYDSPVTLLVLQTIGLGLGALPAFWIGRDHLQSDFAGLVFALAYLLAPAVEGANLSDFHTVSLTPALLLFAFYFLRARRYRPFFASIILAMATKEDVPLLIMMLGLYIFFWLRQRRIGAITALAGLSWFLICTQLILPYYNGLSVSPFLHRLAIFGPTVTQSLLNLLRDPLLLVRWLSQPEVITYLLGLLSTTGFASLFAPSILVVAAPSLAINIFSAWNWTYSEGAHYSASIVPFVILSGIYGVGFLSRQFSKWWGMPRQQIVKGLAMVVLFISGYHHYQIGVSPIARTFYPPRVTAHHRLARDIMALIPPDASVSAQSGLYPHIAHREKAYFFPAINDAQYVFLDVTSSSYPLAVEELYTETQRLLSSKEFAVLAAQDGYLLLERKGTGESTAELPRDFYTFAVVDGEPAYHPLAATFGDALQLVGYDYSLFSVVNAHGLPATVITYWRPLAHLDADYGFAFFFTRQDGAIVGEYTRGMAASLWYPTTAWQEGDLVRIETPILSVGRLQDVMTAVTLPCGDAWSVDGRLRPVEAAGDSEVQLFEDGSLLRLFGFPEVSR